MKAVHFFAILWAVSPIALCLLSSANETVVQNQFSTNTRAERYPEQPEPRLLSSVEKDYMSLYHPRFPRHLVRVKKTDFCDLTVNAYTGYIDVNEGAKHLFFYFFESRRKPDEDDVMMWINGGPGCSSSMGLFMELGPCRIDPKSPNGTIWNPYSWNAETNIFFLDQPVGVGFSYADFGETVETTEDAAQNVYAFISIFFETFKQFSGRPLHLAGESYGGRYLPVFASEIYDKNRLASDHGGQIINLRSVLIGNGITDISTLYPGRYEVECGRASFDKPIQSISNCVHMKTALPRCEKLMQLNCIDLFDEINCRGAVNFCNQQLSTPMWESGRNVYDMSKTCEGELCYKEINTIKEYLDRPDIRELLGVETPNNFSACSDIVGENFAAHMDKWSSPTQHYVSNLLDRGVPVLIYAGTYDWQCNWVANKLWVEKLQWSGREVYHRTPWRGWKVDGKTVGEAKQTPLLTFVTIRGAGHMISSRFLELLLQVADILLVRYVPFDKPKEALALVSRWISHQQI